MSFEGQMRAPRTRERTRVLMTGTLLMTEGALDVKIRNISGSGALVCAGRSIQPGCDVLFKKGPLVVAATVVWSRGKQSGLRFYRDLSTDDLACAFHPIICNQRQARSNSE